MLPKENVKFEKREVRNEIMVNRDFISTPTSAKLLFVRRAHVLP